MSDEITISRSELARMLEAAVAEKLAPLEARLVRAEARGVSQNATLVVFSGDFERAMASFIIATGAAAMDMQVSMFFTFWGISLLKKKTVYTGKSFAEKALSWFLPAGTAGLPTSRMNLLGLGPAFFKNLMRQHRVASLPSLIQLAEELGVKMVACQMSMGLMGIRAEELRPSVQLGGVASYLEDAADSRVTLFL